MTTRRGAATSRRRVGRQQRVQPRVVDVGRPAGRPPRRRRGRRARRRCSIARTVSSRMPVREASSRMRPRPSRGLRVPVAAAELAQRVEDVDVEPDVGVGQPVGAGPGVEERRRRPGRCRPSASASRASPRAEIPSQQGSPIWQARAKDCSSSSAARVEVAARQARPRPSRACGHGRNESQWSRSASSTRRARRLVGRVEVAAQQADPAQHRQGERLAPRLARRAGERTASLEQRDGPRVVGRGRWPPSRGRSSPWPGPTGTPSASASTSVSHRSARS